MYKCSQLYTEMWLFYCHYVQQVKQKRKWEKQTALPSAPHVRGSSQTAHWNSSPPLGTRWLHWKPSPIFLPTFSQTRRTQNESTASVGHCGMPWQRSAPGSYWLLGEEAARYRGKSHSRPCWALGARVPRTGNFQGQGTADQTQMWPIQGNLQEKATSVVL